MQVPGNVHEAFPCHPLATTEHARGPFLRDATTKCRRIEPEFVGPYRLLAELGEGAMGKVYRAEHVLLGREVALKMLHPELAREPDAVARFMDEARAVNLARSEHIVQITDLSWGTDGETYLVMELLEGQTLNALRTREPLSLLRILRIARQLCDALTAVHAVGVIHRDLKPDNVFVTVRGAEDHVTLIDFGVVKLLHQEHDAQVRPDLVVGTPAYMAPEQAVVGPVDARCDLYALGVVLFELIAGELPLCADTIPDILRALVTVTPPRLGDLMRLPADVHGPLEQLLARCLDKDPAVRPQSASDVAAELDVLIESLDGPPIYCKSPHHEARETPTTRLEPRRRKASRFPADVVAPGRANGQSGCATRGRRMREPRSLWAWLHSLGRARAG